MMAWWGKESKRLTDKMAQATGLPKQQAQALAGIAWDLHLLGNRMPGNTLVQWVLAPPQIERNLEANFSTLFKGHPEYAQALRRALRDALQAGGSEADQSALMLETLQKATISEMLLRRWGRTLAKHGIALTGNGEDTGRLELFLDMWESSPSDDRLP